MKPYDVITMVVDTHEGTLRFLVNGIDAGVAFGPSGSGAVCELPDGEAPFSWGGGAVLFPSCSLTNDKQARGVLRQWALCSCGGGRLSRGGGGCAGGCAFFSPLGHFLELDTIFTY